MPLASYRLARFVKIDFQSQPFSSAKLLHRPTLLLPVMGLPWFLQLMSFCPRLYSSITTEYYFSNRLPPAFNGVAINHLPLMSRPRPYRAWHVDRRCLTKQHDEAALAAETNALLVGNQNIFFISRNWNKCLTSANQQRGGNGVSHPRHSGQ